ncbi:hypothetical protein FRB94_003222, partial [Tulasnella sp. JGI-2019a]
PPQLAHQPSPPAPTPIPGHGPSPSPGPDPLGFPLLSSPPPVPPPAPPRVIPQILCHLLQAQAEDLMDKMDVLVESVKDKPQEERVTIFT